MRKKKLLTVLLFCLGLAGLSLAAEVISIDLNAQGNSVAYGGEAAIAGENVWRAFFQGTGIPMGSDRTAQLREYDEPNLASTYAAQVWIAVPAAGTLWEYVGAGNSTGLMDDGFKKKAGATADPCISFIGEPVDPCVGGSGAYSGTFDIYVYGATDGNVTLSSPGYGSVTKPLGGGNFDGDFVVDEDYVVFEDVSIDDGNNVVPGDGNTVVIKYTNQINGIQLVSNKEPVAMQNGTVITAAEYDVAYETNGRGVDEIHGFGPDLAAIDEDAGDLNEMVSYLQAGEYMKYDITVDEADAGEYEILGRVGTLWGPAAFEVYVDDILLGALELLDTGFEGIFNTSNTVVGNLFEGPHTIKWRVHTSEQYFDIVNLAFTRLDDVNMVDCNEVYFYQKDYINDFTGDCRVDAADLAFITDNWVECYSPDPNECP